MVFALPVNADRPDIAIETIASTARKPCRRPIFAAQVPGAIRIFTPRQPIGLVLRWQDNVSP